MKFAYLTTELVCDQVANQGLLVTEYLHVSYRYGHLFAYYNLEVRCFQLTVI